MGAEEQKVQRETLPDRCSTLISEIWGVEPVAVGWVLRRGRAWGRPTPALRQDEGHPSREGIRVALFATPPISTTVGYSALPRELGGQRYEGHFS